MRYCLGIEAAALALLGAGTLLLGVSSAPLGGVARGTDSGGDGNGQYESDIGKYVTPAAFPIPSPTTLASNTPCLTHPSCRTCRARRIKCECSLCVWGGFVCQWSPRKKREPSITLAGGVQEDKCDCMPSPPQSGSQAEEEEEKKKGKEDDKPASVYKLVCRSTGQAAPSSATPSSLSTDDPLNIEKSTKVEDGISEELKRSAVGIIEEYAWATFVTEPACHTGNCDLNALLAQPPWTRTRG
ncbi:uncharacterized protein PG986_011192 [Apiospora aurea]|uniref:Zn(2)-C6 fungal-type domain-containing protein n=1 Tax=Apiospora aurea TaxID=335848 RepID=A0ABR1Q4V7_9PEZI